MAHQLGPMAVADRLAGGQGVRVGFVTGMQRGRQENCVPSGCGSEDPDGFIALAACYTVGKSLYSKGGRFVRDEGLPVAVSGCSGAL